MCECVRACFTFAPIHVMFLWPTIKYTLNNKESSAQILRRSVVKSIQIHWRGGYPSTCPGGLPNSIGALPNAICTVWFT